MNLSKALPAMEKDEGESSYPSNGSLADDKPQAIPAKQAPLCSSTVTNTCTELSEESALTGGAGRACKKIAIVGIGMRYPDFIDDPTKLLKFLMGGKDSIREIPEDRWDANKFYHPDPSAEGMAYAKRGSFLHDDIFKFDANFFGISPVEAETMDPQQRLLLEVTFEAFQDAGIPISSMKGGNVGTFIAGFLMDHQVRRMGMTGRHFFNRNSAASGSATMLSNRISHIFDFTGPSITVDTACSGSLAALHLACSSLQQGETDIAIAGGSNIMLTPWPHISMCKAQLMAKDGHSKSFFANGDGYGRGEGVSVVVLKRLSKAVEDNDDIYAAIDATSLNQDGRTQGITLPSQEAQISNIKNALQKANMDPLDIDYVEAHGTGTKAGDPIELNAIGSVYGLPEYRAQPLPVGSIKGNINHTEANAGISGVIKAALTVKYGRVIPHCDIGVELNPNIPFYDLNLRVPLYGEDWFHGRNIKTAAVNSFGYGGTNGHAILSRYEHHEHLMGSIDSYHLSVDGKGPLTFQFSANSEHSLMQNMRKILVWLETNDDPISFPELAYHFNHHFDRMSHLILYRASNLKDLIYQIKLTLDGRKLRISNQVASISSKKNLVWIFTGMGPQWFGMGQELFNKEKVFREKIEECDMLYRRVSEGTSILKEMLKNESESNIPDNQMLTQGSNFCLQVALASLLFSLGVRPDAVVGHSVGEVAASVVVGALDLSQGIRLIYHRGCLLEDLVGEGTMLATGLNEDDAKSICSRFDAVEIAAVNSDTSTVLSGSTESIKKISLELVSKGVFAKLMRVNVAYHSSQIEGIEEDFIAKTRFLKPTAPKINLYSTVTGKMVVGTMQDNKYWFRNCRDRVNLQKTLKNIISDGYSHFIEIGPHPVLATAIKDISREKGVNVMYTLRRKEGEIVSILGTVASLLQKNLVNIERLYAGEAEPSKRIKVPFSYSWEKQTIWKDYYDLHNECGGKSEMPFLDTSVYVSPMPIWHTPVRLLPFQFLLDHVIGGNVVFPGAAFCETALEVAHFTKDGDNTIILSNLSIEQPLVFTDNPTQRFHVELEKNKISILSALGGVRSVHTSCIISDYAYDLGLPEGVNFGGFAKLSKNDIDEKYIEFSKVGINYGPSFQCIESIHVHKDTVFSSLKANHRHKREADFLVHPALLDSAFQSMAFLFGEIENAFLPVSINKVIFRKKLVDHAYCIAKMTVRESNHVIANLILFNERMEECCRIESLICQITDFVRDDMVLNKNLLYKFVNESIMIDEESLQSIGVETLSFYFDAFHDNANENESFSLPEMELHGKSQIILDFRSTHTKELDLYKECKNYVLCLLEFIKKLCTSLNVEFVERLVVIIQNGIQDDSKYPIQPINPGMMAIAGMMRTVQVEVPFPVKVIDSDLSNGSMKKLEKLLASVYRGDEIILREGSVSMNALKRNGVDFESLEEYRTAEDFSNPKIYIEAGNEHDMGYFQNFTPRALHGDEVLIKVNTASFDSSDQARLLGIEGEIVQIGGKVADISCGNTVYTLMLKNTLESHIIATASNCVKIPQQMAESEISQIRGGALAWIVLSTMAKVSKGNAVLISLLDTDLVCNICCMAREHDAIPYILPINQEQTDVIISKGLEDFLINNLHAASIKFDFFIVDCISSVKRPHLDSMEAFGRIITFDKNIQSVPNIECETSEKWVTLQILTFDFSSIATLVPSAVRRAIQKVFEIRKILIHKTPQRLTAEEIIDKEKNNSKNGEIIIDFRNGRKVPTAMETKQNISYDDSDVVLITGGCGGFGLRSALEIADWGPKNIILASRRGKVQESDHETLIQIRKKVNVIEYALDITSREAISRLLKSLTAWKLNLCGIIHSATVFADKLLINSSQADFMRAFKTKAIGAWNLHQEMNEIPLKFFICYSSVSSCLGNQGQAAYAASNSFLDGLMAFRNLHSMVGTSISWGAIQDVGYVNDNKHVSDFQQKRGILTLDPKEGLALMKEILHRRHHHIIVQNHDWNIDVGITTTIETLLKRETLKNNKSLGIMNELLVLGEAERINLIEITVLELFHKITGHNNLTRTSVIATLGIDSLATGHIQIGIRDSFGVQLQPMKILGAIDVAQLSCQIEKEVRFSARLVASFRRQPGVKTLGL